MVFLDPKKNINQLKIGENMKVADFGAGSGFYSIEMAKELKGEGVVYAIDVQKELLEKIKSTAEKEDLTNIEIIWGDIEKIGGSKLADYSIDIVILSNILFQVEDKNNLLEEIKRVLKQKGQVLVVDWEDSFGGIGPEPGSVFSKESAKNLFEDNNFALEKEFSAGDNHYGFIFIKDNN